MRVLILSDIHLRHRQIDTILSWETHDRVIMLGDYFDQWSDTPAQNAATALWLKGKLDDPRFIGLIGNHDCQHIWPVGSHVWHCENSRIKVPAVRAILSQSDLDKLKLYHVESDILFSHAGLTLDWFSMAARYGRPTPAALTLPNITAWLDQEWPKIRLAYEGFDSHMLMEAGRDRGGTQQVGGITWSDFTGHKPIPGIAQIVGHSVQDLNKGPLLRINQHEKSPCWRFASKGINPRWLTRGWTLCMDTHNHHYAVLEDDVLTIKSVEWSRPAGSDEQIVEPGEILSEIRLKEPAHA